MSSQNVEYLNSVYERWGRGDFHADSSFTDDMTLTLAPEFPDPGEHRGPEGIAAYMEGFLESWERITISAEQIIDCGDKVLVHVLQAGTGKASGIAVELHYFQVWSFDGPKPTRMEMILEESDALARVGDG